MFGRKNAMMVTADMALPGRTDQTMPVPAEHFELGTPLVGPWPGTARTWLATGHEGLGITTAPATAEVLAAGLLGRQAPLPAAPLLPARLQPAPVAGGVR